MVEKIPSEIFTSNTYTIASLINPKEVWLLDCGTYLPVIDSLPKDFILKGIFITHYHYDHIYFISQWLDLFPDIFIYGSESTQKGMASSKRNLSFYHDDPVELKVKNFKILHDGDKIHLFDDTHFEVIETEGHCEGSLSFIVDNYIFTGDALIPNIPTVTKLKTGNKLTAMASIAKIKSIAKSSSIICPGHLGMSTFNKVDWNMYLSD